MRYSIAVVTRAIGLWDCLLVIVPKAKQPTPLQVLRCDLQVAFREAAAEYPNLERFALAEACKDGGERSAHMVAAILMPYLNGKAGQ